ncbi:hypothetical protein [Streptomyces sp. NPDC127038]|uniref:hypothetical protein n=1 Tax=Streptomyces sp. NPDC127038 TaxID=3347114 RepID=UPI0036531399
MHDHASSDATPGPGADELARVYLDSLEEIMDPKEYADLRVLTFTLLGAIAESAGPDEPPYTRRLDVELTPAVIEEWLILTGIRRTGRMDQKVVEVGDGSRTVVDDELASDPQALEAFCAEVRARNREREQEREFLKRIEADSGW